MSELMPWTRSKQDIYSAYKEIHKKYETAMLQKSSSKIVTERESRQRHELEERLQGATPESVVDGIARMKKTMAKVLDELSSALVNETQQLSDIKKLVASEKQELSELKDKALVQIAIETLIQEFDERKVSLERDHLEAKTSLEAEIETLRQDWKLERDLQKKVAQEFEIEIKKVRDRDEESYQYLLNQVRQKDNDEIANKKAAFERDLAEKLSAFENELKERENQIKATETELKILREQQNEHAKELKTETDRVRSEVTDRLTMKYSHELELLKQSKEASEKNYENRIQALESYIVKQDRQIDLLNQKFDVASAKVQEIAAKAIEGASNSGALGAVNRIALEQAKGRTQRPESQ